MVIIETKGRTFADRAANSVECCCGEDRAVRVKQNLLDVVKSLVTPAGVVLVETWAPDGSVKK